MARQQPVPAELGVWGSHLALGRGDVDLVAGSGQVSAGAAVTGSVKAGRQARRLCGLLFSPVRHSEKQWCEKAPVGVFPPAPPGEFFPI